jgi:hypothetical protein
VGKATRYVALTKRGQKEKALGSLRKAEQLFQEMGMDYYLAKTQEVLRKL